MFIYIYICVCMYVYAVKFIIWEDSGWKVWFLILSKPRWLGQWAAGRTTKDAPPGWWEHGTFPYETEHVKAVWWLHRHETCAIAFPTLTVSVFVCASARDRSEWPGVLLEIERDGNMKSFFRASQIEMESLLLRGIHLLIIKKHVCCRCFSRIPTVQEVHENLVSGNSQIWILFLPTPCKTQMNPLLPSLWCQHYFREGPGWGNSVRSVPHLLPQEIVNGGKRSKLAFHFNVEFQFLM